MDYVISWFYRETICYLLFLKAAANPTVRWRNGRYRLKWGGLAEEIRDPAAAAASTTNPIASGADLKIQINNETALQLTPHLSPVANDYDYDDEYDIYEFDDQENNGSTKALASQNMNGSNQSINNSSATNNNGFNKAAILGSLMTKKQPVGGGSNNTLTNKKSGLSHKRTSSYSVMMMKQQQQQQNSSNTYMKHSDGEGTGPSSPLLLQLHPQSHHHQQQQQHQQQQMTKFTTQNSIGGSNNSLASTGTNTTTGSTIVLNHSTSTNSRTAAQLLKHANGMMNANQISSSSSYQSQSSLNSAQLLLQSAPATPADTRINMFMADSDANNNSIREKEGNSSKYTKLI